MTWRRYVLLATAALLVAGCGVAPPGTPASAVPPPLETVSGTRDRSSAPSSGVELPPEVLAGPDPELGPPPVPGIAGLTVATPRPGSNAGDPPGDGYVGDYCVQRDWLTPHLAYSDTARTVLDPTYMVPAEYVPADLVPVSGAGFGGDASGELVREIVIADLEAIRVDGQNAGAPLDVLSGYRSFGDQEVTFNYWWAMLGYEAAAHRAARPGHSEHQLGTSLDVSSPGWAGRFGDWAVDSPSGAWMTQHAWEYGFVMSYPAGGDLATCYGYEPWHFRWISRDAAAAWHASGLTLHGFLVGLTG